MHSRIAALLLSGVIAVSSGSVRPVYGSDVVAGTWDTYTVIAGGHSYVPFTVVLVEGSHLTFWNLDPALHSVTAVDVDEEGEPLFDSGIVGFASTVDVGGVSGLPASRKGFEFFCLIQPWMRGRLLVVEA